MHVRVCLQMTHINSMRELLYSHTLIKVQINQHDQNQVTDTCQQLASQSHAQLLQLKGRTALFMQAHADVDILMQSPSWQGSSQGHRASQHQLERTWHNADEAEEVQLQAGVQSQLQFLTSAGILMADELDKRGLRCAAHACPYAASLVAPSVSMLDPACCNAPCMRRLEVTLDLKVVTVVWWPNSMYAQTSAQTNVCADVRMYAYTYIMLIFSACTSDTQCMLVWFRPSTKSVHSCQAGPYQCLGV